MFDSALRCGNAVASAATRPIAPPDCWKYSIVSRSGLASNPCNAVQEIKQIILNNDQRAKKVKDDDLPYNFVHGKKIKKIHVPREQLDKLSSGSLVIVNNDGLYHLVSREVAEQIRARDPKRIITAHEDRTPEPGSDDEYYARFQVPDDLDW